MKTYGQVGEKHELPDYYFAKPEEPKERKDVVYFEVEKPPHDVLAYARETIDELSQDEYFINSGVEHGIDMSDPSSNDYLRHFSYFIEGYIKEPSTRAYYVDNFGEQTAYAIELFGTAPYAVRQSQALDAARVHDGYGSDHAKDTVVAFNHTMLNMIEQGPDQVRFDDLVEQLELTVTSYDNDARAYAHNTLLDIVDGMRTEYAVFTAVNASESFKARRSTEQEDRQGTDVVVTTPGDRELPIDVKSSMTGVGEKLGRTNTSEHDTPYGKLDDGSFVYHVEVDNSMFMNNSFKMDRGSLVRLRRKVLEDVQRMAAL